MHASPQKLILKIPDLARKEWGENNEEAVTLNNATQRKRPGGVPRCITLKSSLSLPEQVAELQRTGGWPFGRSKPESDNEWTD